MKKFSALILIITSLLLLVSCGEAEYPPVESTDIEAQTVMTVSIENEKYNVKYELYRALFLNLRETVDGGDKTIWTSENKAQYINQIDEMIKSRAVDIYSVLHCAKKVGIDPYSSEFNTAVEEFISASVEGGYYDEQPIEGFGGDYQKYLESLKKMNLNYSVQDLLLRYSLASEKLYEYYAGYMSGEFVEESVQGKLEYTKDDVSNFYNSNDCVRVIRAYLPKAYFSRNRAEEIRNTIIEKANYGNDDVINYIIGITSTAASDIQNGEIIGKHNLDSVYYGELESAAFELAYFEVSNVIEISTGYDDGYVILYKIAKTSDHFDACYDSTTAIYVQNEIGKIIDTAAAQMLESITHSSILETLDRSAISMD